MYIFNQGIEALVANSDELLVAVTYEMAGGSGKQRTDLFRAPPLGADKSLRFEIAKPDIVASPHGRPQLKSLSDNGDVLIANFNTTSTRTVTHVKVRGESWSPVVFADDLQVCLLLFGAAAFSSTKI